MQLFGSKGQKVHHCPGTEGQSSKSCHRTGWAEAACQRSGRDGGQDAGREAGRDAGREAGQNAGQEAGQTGHGIGRGTGLDVGQNGKWDGIFAPDLVLG